MKMLRGCLVYILFGTIFLQQVYAQDTSLDSLVPVHLNEVLVISASQKLNYQNQRKPLSALDEFLESARNINMIKRGAYAWEPTMNGMESQRLAVTIDGMQIFGACTDKMDPVTSYVDVSNLREIQVQSGQQAAVFGNTIGGGINLKIDRSDFRKTGWDASLESAYESNNNMRVFGGELNYSDDKFYLNTDAIYRKAGNYHAGGGEEVNFSQFEKYNFSVNTGYKISEDRSLAATFIYDEARDVGYPALPMDVSLARAYIASLSFRQDVLLKNFSNWETKVYYNNIEHIMDDTQRPDVPIHMDMPGWSETLGFYSQAGLMKEKNHFFFKLDGYYNKSLAEMTMYPRDPNEPPMFMLTWPDVHTSDLGFYAEDHVNLNAADWLKFSTRLGYHSNSVKNDFGLKSLRIFYPEMERDNTRFLKSFSAQYHRTIQDLSMDAVISYGERAPSVSEGYGFYLFNSFDNHDYVGDPELNTESSAEAAISLTYKKPELEMTLGARYFHIFDYIIGSVDTSLSTMTIGADGVKLYENLDYARLFNISFSGKYAVTRSLDLTGQLSYHRGTDDKSENLPLISPVSYRSALEFYKNQFLASVSIEGAAEQTEYNPSYGETKTAPYTVFSAALGKSFLIRDNDLFLKAGIENIFDRNYSTYTDWKNIPRMGRNIYFSISYAIY